MLTLCYVGLAVGIASIGGEWASPANTALLIILALVQTWTLRKSKQEREFIAKQVVEVKEQVTPGTRNPDVRTRKEDQPPWQQQSE